MSGWLERTVFLHTGFKLAVAAYGRDEAARIRTAAIHLAALRGDDT
jgi:hypothetical protein